MDEKSFNGIVADNKLYYDNGSNYFDIENYIKLEGEWDNGPVTVKVCKKN